MIDERTFRRQVGEQLANLHLADQRILDLIDAILTRIDRLEEPDERRP